MRNQKQSRMLRVMALVFGIAFAICLLPNKLVKADVVTLAEPKDAAQTVSVEDGVRVEWTKVTGATQYFYSYSADNQFVRGPLGYFAFVTSGFYAVV